MVEDGFYPLGEPEEWDRIIDGAAGIGERRPLRLGEFTARYRVRTPEGTFHYYLVAESP